MTAKAKNKDGAADAQRIVTLAMAAVRRATIDLQTLAETTLAKAWLSYAVILVLQTKVIWRIWEIRDITYGDTSSYFMTAKKWSDEFLLNIVWSPLYTVFYGSFLFLSSDPYNATIMHRVVIVLAAAMGVLFVLRQVLPPSFALLGAAWWAILPINYDAMYEVHLFALLPILLSWMLLLGKDAPWARGAAVAILATSAVLVRNEFLVAAIVTLLLCIVHELHRSKNVTTSAAAYGTPLAGGIALCGLAYWRSTVKIPEIWPALHVKHTLNMCQVYAFGYQQRHPEWIANPWTECQTLAHSTFGVDYPSISHMLWSNPIATITHFWWNLGLVPTGLEVLLFNARAGGFEPDYVPSTVANYPLALGALVVLIMTAGAILAWRERSKTPLSWISNRSAIAFLPLLVMAVPVVLTQRPRPEYLFYVSVIVIAATIGSIGLMLRHWPAISRGSDVSAFALVVALIHFMSHYHLPSYLPSGRPLLQKLEHLTPQRAIVANAQGSVVLGGWASNLLYYLDVALPSGNPLEGPQVVFGNDLLRRWKGTIPLEQFLAEQQVHVLYLDPSELAWLRAQAKAKNMLDNPRAAGWLDLAHEERGDKSWALFMKLYEK